jgi:hypothetical protein
VRFNNIDLAVGYSKLDYAAKYENRYFGPMLDATIAAGLTFASFGRAGHAQGPNGVRRGGQPLPRGVGRPLGSLPSDPGQPYTPPSVAITPRHCRFQPHAALAWAGISTQLVAGKDDSAAPSTTQVQVMTAVVVAMQSMP